MNATKSTVVSIQFGYSWLFQENKRVHSDTGSFLRTERLEEMKLKKIFQILQTSADKNCLQNGPHDHYMMVTGMVISI